MDSLPGQKLLLKGNHDLWFSTKTKVERFFAENGFSTLTILFKQRLLNTGSLPSAARGAG